MRRNLIAALFITALILGCPTTGGPGDGPEICAGGDCVCPDGEECELVCEVSRTIDSGALTVCRLSR